MNAKFIVLSFIVAVSFAGLSACGNSDGKAEQSTSKPDGNQKCRPPLVLSSDGKCVSACGSNQHEENGVCVDDGDKPLECGPNQHEENGVCVDDGDKPLECGSNQHEENGVCVDDGDKPLECGPNQHEENGVCVDDDDKPIDPCKGVTCEQGSCQQGICVTDEMKAVNADDPCDVETFVEFCDGNRSVYCDQGFVQIGSCSEGCVVYEETYNGRPKMQSGCIDGGSCKQLDELKRTCGVVDKKYSQVLATACQRTVSNELKYVSVDGYYCKGACDAKGEKCELVADECDPYDKSNYSCKGTLLTQCYLDSQLIGVKRTIPCQKECVSVSGFAMCGMPCEKEGDRSRACVYADSTEHQDSGDMVCVTTDAGKLSAVWTRDYTFCEENCNTNTGKCE